MKFPFFKSFFNTNKTKSLSLPESLLIKSLKTTARNNNFFIFEDITIYHHNNSFSIPLLLVDETRGIFLFEYKDWSYNELKTASIEKASQQDSAKDTLAFEKAHDYIKRKFNELKHNDGVPIFNYLLMENLNNGEYKHLDESFKELLPQERIMFNDSSQEAILDKLVEPVTYNLPNTSTIMSTLLIQYAIIDYEQNIFLASEEQMQFINADLEVTSTLRGLSGSGKTSSILLKAILEKLKKTSIKVIIIKPTNLACDILRKKLLDSVEHAIITIDLTSISILTPNEFLETKPKDTDLIICDDIELYTDEFLLDIKNTRYKKNLILVENSNIEDDAKLDFSQSFRGLEKKVIFYEANEHAKILHVVSNLLTLCEAKDILIVSNSLSRQKLQDDLEEFIEEQTTVVNSSTSLINQDLNHILLANYDDTVSLQAKYVLLTDIASADVKKLEYAYNLCSQIVYIVYDSQSENLELLRNNFENNKNS